MRKKKNAFTLIELIAVLVIMAIIALIVTPLVMNIVKKAKDSANKRSVDAYGKAVELGVATHLLDTGDYPTTLDVLTVEYSGNEVVCNVKTLNEDGSIYLSECSVKGTEVKDTSTEDGWYHYGKSSPIAYQSYSVGDIITYNGMNFYVIANSDESSDRITMLKAEPLTVGEVNTYGGVGTDNNHVNMYVTPDTTSYYQKAFDKNGYGGMAYYTSSTCGYVNSSVVDAGCLTDYNSSEIKYVVDVWAIDKFSPGVLVEDSIGYSARLLTYDDFTENLGYEFINNGSVFYGQRSENTPTWAYNSNYYYWTMSVKEDSNSTMWLVHPDGIVVDDEVINHSYSVRPVVTILKSAI